MEYYVKYKKYKEKYSKIKHSNKKIIIHVSGSQGSGKSTMGNKLF